MIVLVLGNLMAPLAALGVVLAFLLSPRRRVLRGLPRSSPSVSIPAR